MILKMKKVQIKYAWWNSIIHFSNIYFEKSSNKLWILNSSGNVIHDFTAENK